MVMAVAAAASVVFSLTSMTAFCITPDTFKSSVLDSTVLLKSDLGPMLLNFFTSVIYELFYQAKVFVRLDWKSIPMTNTLAYYENP